MGAFSRRLKKIRIGSNQGPESNESVSNNSMGMVKRDDRGRKEKECGCGIRNKVEVVVIDGERDGRNCAGGGDGIRLGKKEVVVRKGKSELQE